jgi:hypothetical protein
MLELVDFQGWGLVNVTEHERLVATTAHLLRHLRAKTTTTQGTGLFGTDQDSDHELWGKTEEVDGV